MKAKILPITPMASNRMHEARIRAKALMMPIFLALDAYDIPKDKHKLVIEFTISFYSRNKQMSHARVVKKVAEAFHLSLK
ncbi:MAG: hypothetical protein ABIT05_01340 [Chitinophagaceae bacterium]